MTAHADVEVPAGQGTARGAGFGEFYRDEYPAASRVVRSRLGAAAAADVEDVVQVAFERVLRLWPDLPPGEARWYLFHCLDQRVTDARRRRGTARRRLAALDQLDESPADDRHGPVASVERGADRVALRAALDRLSEHQRAVVLGRAVHGLTYREMSAERGTPEATLRQHYTRGLHGLRSHLLRVGALTLAALARCRRSMRRTSAVVPVAAQAVWLGAAMSVVAVAPYGATAAVEPLHPARGGHIAATGSPAARPDRTAGSALDIGARPVRRGHTEADVARRRSPRLPATRAHPPKVHVCVQPGEQASPACAAPFDGDTVTLHLLPGVEPSVTQDSAAACWAVPEGQRIADCRTQGEPKCIVPPPPRPTAGG